MSSSVATTGRHPALPPGPPQRFPGQTLLGFTRDPLASLQEMAAYGDVSHFRVGRQLVYLANHPDLVRDVLVTHGRRFAKGRGLERARVLLGNGLLTSEGDVHLRQRRLVQPAFHRARLVGYAEVMSEVARRHAGRWRDGEPVDVARAMTALTLAIVGRTLFDADVEGEAHEIGEVLGAALEHFNLLLPFSELLEYLPLPATLRFRRARRRLDATIYRLVEERRASGADRGDLLSMLLAARDDDGSAMSDEQLRDEAMTLFLAGHETTAVLLSWAWWLLAHHPDVERALHAEVDALAGPPTFADVERLPYARMVVSETMRLYPPAYVLGRRALEPYELGGWEIPARSIILTSQWLLHRDPRFWVEPLRFDPERWRPGAAEGRPKFAYFPFGAGTRVCVGEHFAWTEAILVLATLARRVRFTLTPASERAAPHAIVTLRPRHGIPMHVRLRAASPHA